MTTSGEFNLHCSSVNPPCAAGAKDCFLTVITLSKKASSSTLRVQHGLKHKIDLPEAVRSLHLSTSKFDGKPTESILSVAEAGSFFERLEITVLEFSDQTRRCVYTGSTRGGEYISIAINSTGVESDEEPSICCLPEMKLVSKAVNHISSLLCSSFSFD